MFGVIPASENVDLQVGGNWQVASPEKKFWGPWATAGLGFVVFMLHSVTQIATLVIIVGVKLARNPESDISQFTGIIEGELGLILALAVITSTIVGVGLIILFARLPGKISISDYLGFRAVSGKTLLWSLAIAIGFLLLSEGFGTITGTSSNTDLQINAYKTSMWPPLLFFAVVVIGPAFEEIFFRGFLFEGFRNSRIKIVGTIILTSLLWTTLHIQYDFYGMITIFVLGIIIGIVRFRTNSLWSCLLIHFLVNLTAMIQTTLIVNGILT
jgi:uncharacterized protein